MITLRVLGKYDGRIILQLFRFCLVGGLATIIHWCSSSYLYKYSVLSLNLSIFFGWFFAALFSFFGHYYLTFMNSSKGGWIVFWRFLMMSVLGVLVGQFIANIGSKWPDYYQYSIAIAAIFPAFVSFIVGKLWIFK